MVNMSPLMMVKQWALDEGECCCGESKKGENGPWLFAAWRKKEEAKNGAVSERVREQERQSACVRVCMRKEMEGGTRCVGV